MFAHSNVTRWAAKAEGFDWSAVAHVAGIAELHIGERAAAKLRLRLKGAGWAAQVQHSEQSKRSESGTHAGVLVMARSYLSPVDVDYGTVFGERVSEFARSRWAGCILRLKGVTLLFVEAYLLTGSAAAGRSMEVLKEIAICVRFHGLPTVISADWQATVEELAKLGWLQSLDLQLVVPAGGGSCTSGLGSQRSRLIDFFAVSRCLVPSVKASVLKHDVPWRPHSLVQLSLDGRPRQVMVTMVRSPAPLPAGGLTPGAQRDDKIWQRAVAMEPRYLERFFRPDEAALAADCELRGQQLALGRQLARASLRIELYLLLAQGVKEGDVLKFLGRSQPLCLISRPLVSRRYAVSRYACPRLDFWSSALALASKMGSRSQESVRIARLLSERLERCGPHWLTHEGDLLNCEGFQRCCRRDVGGPQVTHWVAVQQGRASRSKRKQLDEGFKSWLAESLVKGGGAIHKAIKPVRCSGRVAVTLEGGQLSADPQDVLREKAAYWKSFWQREPVESTRRQIEVVVADLARRKSREQEQQPTSEELEQLLHTAVKGYSSKKSAGCDSWSVAELKQLPGFLKAELGRCLWSWTAAAVLPAQLLCNLMPQLPKPSGGERCIAKTPLLYRLWTRSRRRSIVAWEQSKAISWDGARKGSSVESVALLRQWKAEIAAAEGKCAAACLWDIAKFFDSVALTELHKQATMQNYPEVELSLALQQYSAHRVLQRDGCAGEPFLVSTSILPGCGQAVPLARAYIRHSIVQVVSEGLKDGVGLTTFVDDIGQDAQGSLEEVVLGLTCAGACLVGHLRKLKLKVADKSVVVASDPKVALLVQKQLRKEGVSIAVAKVARDLGVAYTAGCRARANMTRVRIGTAICKLAVLKGFVRRWKPARKVIVAATLPQAAWGVAAGGMSDAKVQSLRTAMVASATDGKARCRTTFIAAAFGMAQDPAIGVPARVLRTWLQLIQAHPELRAKTRTVWKAVHAAVIVDGRPKWHAVTGPIGAVIATMVQSGWAVDYMEAWRSPLGERFALDFAVPVSEVIKELSRTLEAGLWLKASRSWNGSGMQAGVVKQETFRLMRQLRKHEDHREAALLETIMTNGCWSDHRKASVHEQAPDDCRHCGLPNTDLHFLWTCPRHVQDEREEVRQSQRYEPTEEQFGEAQAFYARGLLLADRVEAVTPFRQEFVLRFVGRCPEPGNWPGGTYGTDGSGGDNSSAPLLRRCGLGIAQLKREGATWMVDWAAYSALPGELHTVPRAEATAILLVLEQARADVPLHFVVDARRVVERLQLYIRLPHLPRCAAANYDVWARIRKRLAERAAPTTARWIKSHPTVADLARYDFTLEELAVNAAADIMADLGAKEARVGPGDACKYRVGLKALKAVQKRLLCVWSEELRHRAQGQWQGPLPLRPFSRSLAAMAAGTKHALVATNAAAAGVWCRVCKEVPCRAELQAWLRSPCEPALQAELEESVVADLSGLRVVVASRELHASHKLRLYRGLYFCVRCGCWAGTRPQKLMMRACAPPTKAGAYQLARLCKGLLPPHLATWPARFPAGRRVVALG